MILLETERYLAVEKDSGVSMATRPGEPQAEARVIAALGFADRPELRMIHRLDVGTSGIVLLARDAEAHRAASRMFQERTVRKTYRTIAWGHPVPARGTIDRPLAMDRDDRRRMRVAPDGKAAITEYSTLERLPSIAHVELVPATGRTHQIRVHLASLGHPIVGDDLYGGPRWRGVKDAAYRRHLSGPLALMLHAAELCWSDPFSGEEVVIRSEEPARFGALLEAARRSKARGPRGADAKSK